MGLKYDAWKNIGASDAVLDWIVNGIKIEFLKTPSPFKLNNKQFSNEENNFVKEEIKRLLDAGYIKHCENDRQPVSLACVLLYLIVHYYIKRRKHQQLVMYHT